MKNIILGSIFLLAIMCPNLCFSEDSEDELGWKISEDESKLDNKKKVFVSKESVDTLPNSIGVPKHGSLCMRCVDNETEVYIVWPSFIGIDSEKIRYKIDDNAIKTETWGTSTDGSAVFVSKPIKFLNSLKGAKRFIIQLSGHNTKNELEFNIAGIDEYIDKIAEYCHWNKKK